MRKLIFISTFLLSAVVLSQSINTGHFDSITTNNPTKPTIEVKKTLDLQTTSGVYIPSGNTAARPTPTRDGLLRYNSETGTAELYSSGSWGAVGGGLSSWVPSKPYSLGDIVIESDKIYKCLAGHTSTIFSANLASGDWVELSQAILDHASLTGIGTNTHTQIDTALTRLANTSGTNTGDQDLSDLVLKNTAITGATKTKITYDSKGLVTSGADATTADIADSTDKRYVTDANLTLLGLTSGTNTGDQDLSGLVLKNGIIAGATKTKITYDSKGLVTSGEDATTADIAASTDKNYVTDSQLTTIGNTSGTNTGDQTNISGNAATVTTNANLTGDVTSIGNATTLTNAPVIAKVLTGYTPGSGTVTSSDSILTAIQKLDGNIAGATVALTGPITSVGNATSIASQTGTGSKIVVDTSPTIITPTLSGNTTAGTINSTTIPSSKTLITTTDNLGNMGATTSAQLAGIISDETGSGSLVFGTSPQFTTSVAIGGTANANAILDVQSTTKAFMPPRMTTAQRVAIASPTAGMVVYDTDLKVLSSYNGTTWQFGFGSIQLDNVYSAKMSPTGTISDENTDWINGNCTTTVCNFNANIFKTTPNCWAVFFNENVSDGVARFVDIAAISTTSMTLNDTKAGVGINVLNKTLFCQKSGADYAAASAQVFAASNSRIVTRVGGAAASASANNPIIFPTIISDTTTTAYNVSTGLYTVPQTGYYDVSMTFAGTFASGSAFYVSVNGGTMSTTSPVICWQQITNGACAGSTTVFATAGQTISLRATAVSGAGFSGDSMTIKKADANQITGSFAGYAKVPGADTSSSPNVDHFIFSYGATATTVCTNPGGSCEYLDKMGDVVTDLTRPSTGTYTIKASKTYAKWKCTGNCQAGAGHNCEVSPVNCANTNTCTFTTTETLALENSFGTIDCKGTY